MPLHLTGQRAAIAKLFAMLRDVDEQHRRTESQHREQARDIKASFARDRQLHGDDFQREHDELSATYFSQLGQARVRYETELQCVHDEEQEAINRATADCSGTVDRARDDWEATKERLASVLDDDQRQRKQAYRELLGAV